jgi:triacylglycerol lipase
MNDHPIVLAHGIAPFDSLRESLVRLFKVEARVPDRLHYFREIASHLRARGFGEVHHARVSFSAPLEQRAEELRADILAVLEQTNRPKAHVIAHSMGGLDSRWMIVKLDMAPRVASLTTIGTPHLGTSLADWGQQQGGERVVEAFGGLLDLRGFLNLTTDFCRALNAELEPAEAGNGVFYQTYASHDGLENVFLPLQWSWKIIRDAEEGLGGDGRNDGLVPLTSQRWTPDFAASAGTNKFRRHDFRVPADHLNQVGYWNPTQLRGKLREAAGPNPLARLRGILDAPRAYENQIKAVYEEIADGVRRDLPQ